MSTTARKIALLTTLALGTVGIVGASAGMASAATAPHTALVGSTPEACSQDLLGLVAFDCSTFESNLPVGVARDQARDMGKVLGCGVVNVVGITVLFQPIPWGVPAATPVGVACHS
jgi:hypothetical protein